MHFQKKVHTKPTFQPKKYAFKMAAWRSPFFAQEKVHTFSRSEPFWYALPEESAYQTSASTQKVCILNDIPAEPLLL